MLAQTVFSIALLGIAAILDQGLPAWAGFAIHPLFLETAWILIVLRSSPSLAVFWAGLAGLISDLQGSAPPGAGIIIQATVALLYVSLRPTESRYSRSSFARWLSALLLVTGTAAARYVLLGDPQVPSTWLPALLNGAFAARVIGLSVLITFLAGLLEQWSGSRPPDRVDVREFRLT